MSSYEVVPLSRSERLAASILDAAFACFERYGVKKTTMRHVAECAGITRPTVYAYYPSKMALAEAAILDFVKLTYLEIVSKADFTASAGEVIANAQQSLIDHFRSPRGEALLRAEDRDFLAAAARNVDSIHVEINGLWRPLLRGLAENGKIRSDVDITLAGKFLHLMNYGFLLHDDLQSLQRDIALSLIARSLE